MTYMVVESNILGFHVYKDVWTPVTGEVLTCELEDEYSFEPPCACVIITGCSHIILKYLFSETLYKLLKAC